MLAKVKVNVNVNIKVKVLIGYYSRTGNTRRMAEAIGRGARKEKAAVVVSDIRKVRPKDLLKYHVIILGSPTYYGQMAAEMKRLLDESVQYHGKLSSKVGGAFTSSGGVACGAETTILSILESLLIHGMIVLGESGYYHYGPAAVGRPDKKVTVACELYGRKLVKLAKKVFS